MLCCGVQNLQDDRIRKALQLLTSGADRLKSQCSSSSSSSPPDGSTSSEKRRLHTQQVIQCAYDIAKAAKQLVIMFE